MSGLAPSGSSIRVLVPGTGARFRCGGLAVALQTARLLGQLRPTEVVTYQEREASYPYLSDLLEREKPTRSALWLVSWGFDVPKLIRKLSGRLVVYQAHSSGYGFDLPPGVPVVAVSRNTLGYWGDRAPRNPLFWVPNALESHWMERGRRDAGEDSSFLRRPIDVLVQQRKSSPYVLDRLVPALRQRGFKVEVQCGWVDDLVGMFNRSTVYLYDSAEYWRSRGVSEGFGLPPLEALSCGCVVFSSFNHALSDCLTPGVTAHQIGQGSLDNDLERIAAAISAPKTWRPPADLLQALLDEVSEVRLLERWRITLDQISDLERHGALGLDPSRALRASSKLVLRWRQGRVKVVKRLSGWLKKG